MKNRFIKPLLSVVVVGFFLILALASSESSYDSESSSNVETYVNVSVEDVKVEKNFSNAWTVIGKIRNNTSSSIKGAVKIKFINSNGDIVHSNRAYVNDGDSFNSGQAASFDYTTDPSNFEDVVDFKVEFYER